MHASAGLELGVRLLLFCAPRRLRRLRCRSPEFCATVCSSPEHARRPRIGQQRNGSPVVSVLASGTDTANIQNEAAVKLFAADFSDG